MAPIFCSVFLDVFRQFLILLLAPRALYHGRVENFLPPVQALHVGSLIEERCDALPISRAKLLNQFGQFVIFLGIPVPFGVLLVGIKLVDVLLDLERILVRLNDRAAALGRVL
jgi:hypothetical protein